MESSSLEVVLALATGYTITWSLQIPIRAAFADREKNHKSLVSGGGSGGGRGGGSSKGGVGIGSDNGGGAGQSPYSLQAFCNSSNSLHLKTHFSRK